MERELLLKENSRELKESKEYQNYLRLKEHYLNTANTNVEGLYMVMDKAITYEDNDTLIKIVNDLKCTWDIANDMLGKVKGAEAFSPTVEHIVSSRFFNGRMLLANVEPYSESLKDSLNKLFDMQKLAHHMFHPGLREYVEE